MTQEVWKEITEYQGFKFSGEWEVSNWGNVRNKSGKVMPYYSDNRGQGYLKFKLYDVDGVRRMIKVHRLVALYFLPESSCHNEVNHIDGNVKNNSYTNLEWCTHKENMQMYSKSLKKIWAKSQLEFAWG